MTENFGKKYTKTVPVILGERYRNTVLQSRLSAKIAVSTYSVVKVLKTKRNSESSWGDALHSIYSENDDTLENPALEGTMTQHKNAMVCFK